MNMVFQSKIIYHENILIQLSVQPLTDNCPTWIGGRKRMAVARNLLTSLHENYVARLGFKRETAGLM